MKIVCKECGKEHETDPKCHNAKFCSSECWKKYTKENKHKSNVEKICKLCGKVFYVRRYREKKADCCSRHCSNTYVGRKNSVKISEIMRGKGSGKSYEKFFHRHLHRVIMENHIGKKLTSNEIVHHINGNIHDNRIENLVIVSPAEHCRIHFAHKTMDEIIGARK